MSLATLLLKLSNMKLENKKDFSCVPSPATDRKEVTTIFIKASLLLKRSIHSFGLLYFLHQRLSKKKREKRKPEESRSRRAPKHSEFAFFGINCTRFFSNHYKGNSFSVLIFFTKELPPMSRKEKV